MQIEPPDEPLAIVVQQSVMRPGDRGAGGQQDQRVQQRQVPRVENLDALRRPVTAGELHLGNLNGAVGGKARIEERPEPGDEEHHLRGDEQDHAVAQAELDDRGVEALVRFLDDVAPPDQHRVEHTERARQQKPRAGAVHERNQANRRDEGRDRADDRPRARIDQMVGMVVRVRLSHDSLLQDRPPPYERRRASKRVAPGCRGGGGNRFGRLRGRGIERIR